MEGMRGYLTIILASLVMSAISIFGKLALSYKISPESIVALRFLVSFSVLSVSLLVLRKELLRIHKRDLPPFLVLGVLGTALQRVVYFYALKYVTATMAIILVFTYPIFITLLAGLFMHERITRKTIVAVALSMAGVSLVVKAYEAHALVMNAYGILFGLSASLLFVLYFFLVKMLRDRYTNLTIIAYGDGIGAIVLGILFVPRITEMGSYPPLLWFLILGIGISSLLGYLLFSYALKHVQSSTGSILMVAEPLGIVLMSALFLGECIEIPQWAGIVMTLAGIVFLLYRFER